MLAIIVRSYLADPQATECELIAEGEAQLATELKVDYQVGRMAENYATLTGKRVLSEPVGLSLGGGLMSPVGADPKKPVQLKFEEDPPGKIRVPTVQQVNQQLNNSVIGSQQIGGFGNISVVKQGS